MKNPFRGLLPFEEEHAGLFFGRDREIGDVAARLDKRRLLAVTGVSGSSKSSLVRAGVIPMLRAGLIPRLGTTVRVAIMKPRGGPLAELQRALSAAFGREIDAAELRKTTYGLVDATKPAGAEESLLLLVDQFEEIFEFRKDHLAEDGGAEADRFVALLLRAVEQTSVPIYVVLTMRSDYLGACAIFRDLPEALNDGHYLVPRMTRHELREAIESPLETVGATIHPGVVQELLNRCAEEPDHLPILQNLLKRLFEESPSISDAIMSPPRGAAPMTQNRAPEISLEDYDKAGGFNGAINRNANAVLGRFSDEQMAVKRLFQRITEKGEGERPIRKPASMAALEEITGLRPARIVEIVGAFVDRELLVVREIEGGGSEVDLPHECLAWKWEHLEQWIDEEAALAKSLEFLSDSAEKQQWLTGSALAEALKLREGGRLKGLWPRRYLSGVALAQVESWIGESDKRAFAEERRLNEERRLALEYEQRLRQEAERRAQVETGCRRPSISFGSEYSCAFLCAGGSASWRLHYGVLPLASTGNPCFSTANPPFKATR